MQSMNNHLSVQINLMLKTIKKSFQVIREGNSRRISKAVIRALNKFIRISGYILKKDAPYIYLKEYSSYEEYASIQKVTNIRKLDKVWADDYTLSLVAQKAQKNIATSSNIPIKGICHGSRNGYEVNKLNEFIDNGNIIGTDISDTAKQFPNLFVWDFHDINPKWVENFDFVYTNSLDQAWKPFSAIETWLGQLKKGGLIFIEHSATHHGVDGVTAYDPFGALPEFMPYVISEKFGHSVSIEIIRAKKENNKVDIWLFVLKKVM